VGSHAFSAIAKSLTANCALEVLEFVVVVVLVAIYCFDFCLRSRVLKIDRISNGIILVDKFFTHCYFSSSFMFNSLSDTGLTSADLKELASALMKNVRLHRLLFVGIWSVRCS
jgi:hypothetical protein